MKMAFPIGEEEKYRMLSSMNGQVRKFVVWRAGDVSRDFMGLAHARSLLLPACVKPLHSSIDNVTPPPQVNLGFGGLTLTEGAAHRRVHVGPVRAAMLKRRRHL
jgi:hypothetical protein